MQSSQPPRPDPTPGSSPDAAPARVARATSERGELVLRRHHDGRLELRVNGVFVMDTYETTTERALAELALAGAPRTVLVGGLGLGFTLAAVLADPDVAEVVVAEIEPAVVTWMTDGTVPHGPALLADPRVEVVVADVRRVVAERAAGSVDAVLLDVDNGPGYLVHDANAAVYDRSFLRSCVSLLRPNGRLLVWSASPAPALAALLRAETGRCTEHTLPVRLGDREEAYVVYEAVAGPRRDLGTVGA